MDSSVSVPANGAVPAAPSVELKEGESLIYYKGKWAVECADGVNHDRGRPCGQQWNYWDRVNFTFFEDDACTKRKKVCVQYVLSGEAVAENERTPKKCKDFQMHF